MKTIKMAAAFMCSAVLLFACEGKSDNGKQAECTSSDSTCTDTKSSKDMNAPFTKKYTNADFYKDGKFQQDVAKKAFYEMFAHYGYKVTPFIEANTWYTDFGLGDFENCGMGGIFWVNDAEHGYFSHDIYLLPGQMIPEHSHVKTAYPAKFESWMVRNGNCYNFTEIGEAKADADQIIPASQLATTKSKNYVMQNEGDIVHLAKEGSWHFLKAGDSGAIVHEYANYHDGAGLRFTNEKAKL